LLVFVKRRSLGDRLESRGLRSHARRLHVLGSHRLGLNWVGLQAVSARLRGSRLLVRHRSSNVGRWPTTRYRRNHSLAIEIHRFDVDMLGRPSERISHFQQTLF
jgi:hypothetical protein